MSDSPKSQFVGRKDTVAPSPGKVAIYQLETRRRVEVWPVDARELLASGEYARELPEEAAAESTLSGTALAPAGTLEAEAAAAAVSAAAGSGSTESTSTASDATPAVVPDAAKAPASTSRRTNRS